MALTGTKQIGKSTIGVGKFAVKGTKHIGKTMLTAISDSPDKRATQSSGGQSNFQAAPLTPLEEQGAARITSPGTMGYDTGSLRQSVKSV